MGQVSENCRGDSGKVSYVEIPVKIVGFMGENERSILCLSQRQILDGQGQILLSGEARGGLHQLILLQNNTAEQ